MTKYLQLNGTSDYLSFPSMTFTEVDFDISIAANPTNAQQLLMAKTNYTELYMNTVPALVNDGGFTTVSPTFGTTIPVNQRTTITASRAAITTDGWLFADNTSGTPTYFFKGNVYTVTFKNGGTVVAKYDMSTGTVQDQSGNGNHAALTGGTWTDDGIIAQDSFNRANTTNSSTGLGTSDTGHVWQSYNTGTGYINNNQGVLDCGDNGQIINIGTNKYAVSVTYYGTNNPQLILGVDTGASDRYTFVEYSGGAWNVYRRYTNWTLLASYTKAFVSGDRIKAVVNGSSITVYLNGTQIMTATDATVMPVSVSVGLGSGGGNNAFDDFLVENLGTTVTVQLAGTSSTTTTTGSAAIRRKRKLALSASSTTTTISSAQLRRLRKETTSASNTTTTIGDITLRRGVKLSGSASNTTTTTASADLTISNPKTLVSDGFNRANGSLGSTDSAQGGTSKPWTPLFGTWSISNKQATVTAQDAAAVVDTGASDVTITMPLLNTNANTQIVFRALNNTTSRNFFVFEATGTSGFELDKFVNGAWSQLNLTSTIVPKAGSILKVVLSGSTITCYQDSTVVFTATDATNQSSTYHGIGRGGTAGTAALYDDFEVVGADVVHVTQQLAGTSSTTTTTGNAIIRRLRKEAGTSNTTTSISDAPLKKAYKLTADTSSTTTTISDSIIRRLRKFSGNASTTTSTTGDASIKRKRVLALDASTTTSTTGDAQPKTARKLEGSSSTTVTASSADLTITAHGVVIQALSGASTTTTTTGDATLKRVSKLLGTSNTTTNVASAPLKKTSKINGTSNTSSNVSSAIVRRLRQESGASTTTTTTKGDMSRTIALSGSSATTTTATATDGTNVAMSGSSNTVTTTSTASLRRKRAIAGTASELTSLSSAIVKRVRKMGGASATISSTSEAVIYRTIEMRGLAMVMTTTKGIIQYKTSNLIRITTIRGIYHGEVNIRGNRKADTIWKGVL